MLRVMTYNVRYFGHPAAIKGAASTRKGISGITKAIAELPQLPHVICLQEVEQRSLRTTLSHSPGAPEELQLEAMMKSLHAALKHLGRKYRYQAHYYPAHPYSINKNTQLYLTGLAVPVRNDLEIYAHNAESPTAVTHRRNGLLAKVKQSRICAYMAVKAPDGEAFEIFNTHLSLPAFASKNLFKIVSRMGYGDNQQEEIDALSHFVESHRQTERYLIVGDFNALPGSPSYNRMLDNLKVRDPFPELLGHSLEELRDEWPTAGFMRFRMRLDHIFAGPGVEWLDYEDTHPFGRPDGRWHGLSDHVPIVGRFESR